VGYILCVEIQQQESGGSIFGDLPQIFPLNRHTITQSARPRGGGSQNYFKILETFLNPYASRLLQHNTSTNQPFFGFQR
jgi:hypothetical protein